MTSPAATPQRRSAGQVEPVVYWTDLAGTIMLAPDSRMPPFRGWIRHEARTTSEIAAVSRKLARQEFDKFRGLRVEEHLRSRARREAIRNNCLLRLAKGCISAADEAATRRTLASINAKDELLLKLLTEEPNLTRGSLVIEQHEQSTSPVACLSKRRGLGDTELDMIAQLAGSTT